MDLDAAQFSSPADERTSERASGRDGEIEVFFSDRKAKMRDSLGSNERGAKCLSGTQIPRRGNGPTELRRWRNNLNA